MAPGPAPPRSPPIRTSADLPEISVTSPNSTDRKTKIPFFADTPITTTTTTARDEDARGRSRKGVRDGQEWDNSDDEDEDERTEVEPRTPARSNGKTASRSREDRPQSASSWASPSRRSNGQMSNYATPNATPQRPESSAGNSEEPQQTHSSPLDPLSQHILDRTALSNSASPDGRRPTSSSNLQRVTTAASSHPRSPTSESASRDAKPSSSSEYSRAPAVQSPPRASMDASTETATGHKDLRKGVKAVSFITRLIGSSSSKKKDADEESINPGGEEESVSNEERPEGNDAQVFAEPGNAPGGGFDLQHSQPPAYIKVRSKYKKQRELDHLFLAQELHGHRKNEGLDRKNSTNKLRKKTAVAANSEPQTVWAMQFSRDGKYLAAAGVDGVVRVWAVLSSFEDRLKHERQERGGSDASLNGSGAGDASYEHLTSPVFQTQPVREYEGHTGTILDLSWSKNNFLLSSSMDKTVRLWHVSRGECLCAFKHKDIVPSVAFHPRDDRFFLAGSLDGKLRLWSVSDKSVAFTASVPDMITAVAFTPDGKSAIAGCHTGLCMFFETDGLKYQSQVHVRSTRGQNAKESKITGIQAFYAATGDTKLLISSNDSRIRLYNFRDKNLEMKFRGHVNSCSQIRACVSDDSPLRVVSGSEDCKAYVWSITGVEAESSGAEQRLRADRRPVEFFEAHDFVTTVACFAPAKTRSLLARSQDAVYDLCNPPPPPSSAMTAMSSSSLPHAETPQTMSNSNNNNSSSRASSSKAPTENGSIQSTPKEAEAPFSFENSKYLSHNKFSPSFGHSNQHQHQHQQQYYTKTNHSNGQILVTADLTGRIKVFRQDCAWQKRRNPSIVSSGGGAGGDEADRASIFSKRGSASGGAGAGAGGAGGAGGGKVSRQGSTATMASTRSQRILQREHGGAGAAAAAGAAAPSERIISWRQGVVSSPNLADGGTTAAAGSIGGGGNGVAPQRQPGHSSSSTTARGGSTSHWSFIPGVKKNSVASDGKARSYPAASSTATPAATTASAAQSHRRSLKNIDTGVASNDAPPAVLEDANGPLSASPTSIRGRDVPEHTSGTDNTVHGGDSQSHSHSHSHDQAHGSSSSRKSNSHHQSDHQSGTSATNTRQSSNHDNNAHSGTIGGVDHPDSKSENPLLLGEGGRSMFFYNTDEWRARAARMRQAAHDKELDPLSSTLSREEEDSKKGSGGAAGTGNDETHLGVQQRPGLKGRDESFVSRLSDERGSSVEDEEEEEEFDDAREG